MAIEVRQIEQAGELAQLAPAWDALVTGRGLQADLYDSQAFLGAWLAAANERERRALRVSAAFADGRLVAALPLVARGARRREALGLGFRPRYRPLAAGEQPTPAAAEGLGAIAEALAAAGTRSLALPVMPTRDPAVTVLIEALGRAGYRVERRETTSDCLASASAGWSQHRKRFRKFDRTARNFGNKAGRLGELELVRWGGPGEAPAAEGFEEYLRLHERGWKGPLREPLRTHRRELIAAAGERGWSRLFGLRLAGVPLAAMLWHRVGRVALAQSTVYDERMAALSAGTVLMWWAHEALVADDDPPALFDYLPGHGPQKDQLAEERPPLVVVEATRGAARIGLGPLVRRAGAAAARRLRRRSAHPATAASPLARTERFEPGEAGRSAAPVELVAPFELYLTVATGRPSPKAMRSDWEEGDEWWRLGEPPALLARLGSSGSDGSRPVREIVLLGEEDVDLRSQLRGLAAVCGAPLTAALPGDGEGAGAPVPPTPVHRAPLPWPR